MYVFTNILAILLIASLNFAEQIVYENEDQFINKQPCDPRFSNKNNDTYITPSYRLELCREIYKDDPNINLLDDERCYKDKMQISSNIPNPCSFSCFAKIIGKDDYDVCSELHLSMHTTNKFRLVGYQKCGQTSSSNYYCTETGCCTNRDTRTVTPTPDTPSPETPSPETPSPETPSPETPSPETPSPETPSPETPSPETPSPETPSPETPSPETPSPETPSPETPSPETPSPETPSPETPSPETPSPETPSTSSPTPPYPLTPTTAPIGHCHIVCDPDWKSLIHCKEEGYFRNPYDCHKFYRCYFDTEMRIVVKDCPKDEKGNQLLWSNRANTCVRERDAEECNNIKIPGPNQQTTPESGTTESFTTTSPLETESLVTKSETPITEELTSETAIATSEQSIESTTAGLTIDDNSSIETDEDWRRIYKNNIQCQMEGQFRNPFNCRKFYRCFIESDNVFMSIELYVCLNGLVYDEGQGKCVNEMESATPCHDEVIQHE